MSVANAFALRFTLNCSRVRCQRCGKNQDFTETSDFHNAHVVNNRYGKPKYRQRNIIERMFGWLKKNRRICYRYDKLVTSFLAMVSLAARCGVYDIIFRILPVGENLDTDKYSYLCKIISYAQVNC